MNCGNLLIILSILCGVTFACFIWALHKIIKLAGMIKILVKRLEKKEKEKMMEELRTDVIEALRTALKKEVIIGNVDLINALTKLLDVVFYACRDGNK